MGWSAVHHAVNHPEALLLLVSHGTYFAPAFQWHILPCNPFLVALSPRGRAACGKVFLGVLVFLKVDIYDPLVTARPPM